jgi:hypothetical protein
MMDRTPGRHEAGSSVEAGTAGLITNEKPLLLPLHISMSATGLMTRLNSMAIPTAYVLGWICRRSNPLRGGTIGKLVGKGPPSP